jgi:hypothetical protein
MWFLNSRLKFWDFYWFSFLWILKSSHFKSVMCPLQKSFLPRWRGILIHFRFLLNEEHH